LPKNINRIQRKLDSFEFFNRIGDQRTLSAFTANVRYWDQTDILAQHMTV